jgi:hypothetical protein
MLRGELRRPPAPPISGRMAADRFDLVAPAELARHLRRTRRRRRTLPPMWQVAAVAAAASVIAAFAVHLIGAFTA